MCTMVLPEQEAEQSLERSVFPARAWGLDKQLFMKAGGVSMSSQAALDLQMLRLRLFPANAWFLGRDQCLSWRT